MDFYLLKNKQGRVKKNHPPELMTKIFRKLFGWDVIPLPYTHEMFTIEQQINFLHLMTQVKMLNVKGDFIELGSFTGSTAIQFEKFLEDTHSDAKLYLYDSFKRKYFEDDGLIENLVENFRLNCLKLPTIIEGDFYDTIPSELPDKIAFAHIDCGFGGAPEAHKEVVLYCLNSIYPRMESNSICVLMDYFDVHKTVKGLNSNPGVKLACDEFFSGKQERIEVLYGGYYGQAFFRKR